VRCLASPDQLRKGEAGPQTLLEGASYVANVEVNQDRRSVRVKLAEKASELDGIQKIRYLTAEGNEVPAEVPLLREYTQTAIKVIPDGGTLLVPVLYRPRAVREKSRWWVLSITLSIIIEAEEKALKGDVSQP
jgi:hypothetical protein